MDALVGSINSLGKGNTILLRFFRQVEGKL